MAVWFGVIAIALTIISIIIVIIVTIVGISIVIGIAIITTAVILCVAGNRITQNSANSSGCTTTVAITHLVAKGSTYYTAENRASIITNAVVVATIIIFVIAIVVIAVIVITIAVAIIIT